MKLTPIVTVAACLVLSACGNTREDRVTSGALIGGGVGLAGGAIVGAPVTGAAVGAAAGAITGAATDNNQINFGKPWWR